MGIVNGERLADQNRAGERPDFIKIRGILRVQPIRGAADDRNRATTGVDRQAGASAGTDHYRAGEADAEFIARHGYEGGRGDGCNGLPGGGGAQGAIRGPHVAADVAVGAVDVSHAIGVSEKLGIIPGRITTHRQTCRKRHDGVGIRIH